MGQDNKMRRCLTTSEAHIVLKELHEGVAIRHFATNIIAKKIQDARYWWPTLFKDIHELCRSYDKVLLENWRIENKKSSQVRNNTSRGTFYKVGSRFYRSN
jgi:hypothetical protein